MRVEESIEVGNVVKFCRSEIYCPSSSTCCVIVKGILENKQTREVRAYSPSIASTTTFRKLRPSKVSYSIHNKHAPSVVTRPASDKQAGMKLHGRRDDVNFY